MTEPAGTMRAGTHIRTLLCFQWRDNLGGKSHQNIAKDPELHHLQHIKNIFLLYLQLFI